MTVESPLRRLVLADLFCGAGGTSEGARQAGITPAIAINHSPAAIRDHEANHPTTEHLQKNIRDIAPLAAARGRRFHAVWASSSCPHFSRARGAAPMDREIRELSFVLCDWARDLRPAVLFLENVPEIATWGPLNDEGRPIPERMGETWAAFQDRLRGLGYAVEHRVLVAADYGAPTTRRRMHLIARCDGRPIRWPEPTHAKVPTPGRLPWRTAGECIDWSVPTRSIFGRSKPLADATMRRIAEGLRRFVLTTGSPFLINTRNGERVGQSPRVHDLGAPMPTVTASGSQGGLVAPAFVRTDNTSDGRLRGIGSPEEPLRTVTTSGGHALMAAWIAKHYGGVVGHGLDRPLGTITATDHHSLVTATIADPNESARRVAAFLVQYYGSGGQWASLDEPMRTIVTKARHGLVTVDLDGEPAVIVDIGLRMLTPRELARAQGFPDSYRFLGTVAEQIAAIGNSQSPPVARALFEANLTPDMVDEA